MWPKKIYSASEVKKFLDINVGMEMNEVHFIDVNREIVNMNFQRHLVGTLSFLHLNSVVSKRHPIEEHAKVEHSPPGASTSISVHSTLHTSQVKKKRRKRKSTRSCGT